MKTKIILILFLISFAGLFAQQKAKLQKVDESGFIEVDKVPELISKLNPEYPKLAKLAGIEGTVYLKLLIDEKGNVVKAKVEQGVKDMIDESALKAAKKAKFSPAILNNKPVKVWVILPVAFKLSVEKKAETGLLKYDELGPTTSNTKDEEPDINTFIQAEKMPELIESVKPAYPEIAKRAGIEGKVFVKVLLGKDGNPKKAVVIKSENEIFNQAATDAALKSKFSPAMDKGNPIAVWIVLPYKFALDWGKKENINNGSARCFDTVEQAKSYYNGYTFMYGNKENREAIGAPKDETFEKIDGQISFGDESELYKVISEKKTKYNFIARKDAIVYQYWAQTIEEIQKYVDELNKKLSRSKDESIIQIRVVAEDMKDNRYPKEAIEKQLEGIVNIRVFFDKATGQLQKSEIVKGVDKILDDAALDLVKKILPSLSEKGAKAKMTEDQKFSSGSIISVWFSLKK
ncbi:MAG: TonB family protein [Melioribacteraceae bacterium]